jgi:hypothetical protein
VHRPAPRRMDGSAFTMRRSRCARTDHNWRPSFARDNGPAKQSGGLRCLRLCMLSFTASPASSFGDTIDDISVGRHGGACPGFSTWSIRTGKARHASGRLRQGALHEA